MRFTAKLNAQHLGWLFKKHWHVQGKRVLRSTGALAEMEKLGIEVKNPQDVVKEKYDFEHFEVIGNKPVILPEDESHPNWHKDACYIYGNKNVLLEGLPQAQLLTNTLEISTFPKNITEIINKLKIPSSVDKSVQNSIITAHLFDAEQVKLPKQKNPDRPYTNLPRAYGISHERRICLLINKLLSECEKSHEGRSLARRRKIVADADFGVTLRRDKELLQFSVTTQNILTSNRPLEAIKGSFDGPMPDLYPLKCTITIPKKNIYTTDLQFPFGANINCSHPHTIFMDFDKEKVRNLHGSSVSTTQFESRTMLSAFVVASAYAEKLYNGASKGKLEKPIVVQSIQTDGRVFHFGVFQLNTLSLSSNEGIKNYWFHQPSMDLFSECSYKEGRPVLNDYNKDVFRYLTAFYNNV